MPDDLVATGEASPVGVPVDDDPFSGALAIPADVIAAIEAEAKGNHDPTAVERLQKAYGSNEQAVKARLRGQALLALANSGYTRAQIAKLLGLKENTVKVALWRARAAGRLNDLRNILEHDSTALAVDTVNYHLRKKNADVAIEHLKGVGYYKNHSHMKHDGVPVGGMPPLTVNVVVQNAIGGAMPVTPETFDVSEMSVGVPRE